MIMEQNRLYQILYRYTNGDFHFNYASLDVFTSEKAAKATAKTLWNRYYKREGDNLISFSVRELTVNL